MKHSILIAAVLFTVPTFAMAQSNNNHISNHNTSNHQTSNHADMKKSERHHMMKKDCNPEMQEMMKEMHSDPKRHEEMAKMHSNSEKHHTAQ